MPPSGGVYPYGTIGPVNKCESQVRKRRNVDFYVLATLRRGPVQVEGVPCKIYLPTRVTDRLLLLFIPGRDQAKQIESLLPVFSLFAEVPDATGSVAVKIKADEVWTDKITSRHWGPELVDTHFYGKPMSVLISERISEDSEATKHVRGRFWISPSRLLAPAQMITHSYTGEVTVETVRKFFFTFPSGLSLDFDNRYRHIETQRKQTTTFAELVANFEHASNTFDRETIGFLSSLDDFLLLVSLAERRYCICPGWEMTSHTSYFRYYRKNLSLPKLVNVGGELIDLGDFDEFIRAAYAKLSAE
jgi:hypothetical protein